MTDIPPLPQVIDSDAVGVVILFAIIVNRIVEYFFTPIFDKKKWDKMWLMYIALAMGLALMLLTNISVFTTDTFIAPIVGKILTGILVGGGSNLIYDILKAFSNKPPGA